jgi:hypothetical protein
MVLISGAMLLFSGGSGGGRRAVDLQAVLATSSGILISLTFLRRAVFVTLLLTARSDDT